MSTYARSRQTALERRVRAILAARRAGYGFDERQRTLDIVAERVLEDLRRMPDEPSSEPMTGDDEGDAVDLEPIAYGRLRLVCASGAAGEF
ncbi:MAG: hypothetical protein EA379_09045 [Phycisphaerales bacterium]|nr:MAG: hypothetical protein EA379_09045 [Phycisphaerales bacterium]